MSLLYNLIAALSPSEKAEKIRSRSIENWKSRYSPETVDKLTRAHDAYHDSINRLQQKNNTELTIKDKKRIKAKIHKKLNIRREPERKERPSLPQHMIENLDKAHDELKTHLQTMKQNGYKITKNYANELKYNIKNKHGVTETHLAPYSIPQHVVDKYKKKLPEPKPVNNSGKKTPEVVRRTLMKHWQSKHPPEIANKLGKAYDAYTKVRQSLEEKTGKPLSATQKERIHYNIKYKMGVSNEHLSKNIQKNDWHSNLLKKNPNMPEHIIKKLKQAHTEFHSTLKNLKNQGKQLSNTETQKLEYDTRNKHGVTHFKLKSYKAAA